MLDEKIRPTATAYKQKAVAIPIDLDAPKLKVLVTRQQLRQPLLRLNMGPKQP